MPCGLPMRPIRTSMDSTVAFSRSRRDFRPWGCLSGVTSVAGGRPKEAEMDDDEPVRVLTSDECWDFLATQELGRLAFRLLDETHIVPVNFAVDGRTLLFRTDGGTKLFGVELGAEVGAQVAFEVDAVEGETAR